ncbi:hypothetical protein B0A49_02029 [Cryomyces minteri]|uniref:TRAF-type domain-containing protein n=1 Tax=Cryomyces minteri TaxID=331657 RepID=A0A4U0XBX5_9PEZI|nr:hypothetical protein B0A49_02029 [Cryomyces minteri]
MTTERDDAFAWQAQLEATPRDPPLVFDIVARQFRPAERPATPLMEQTSPLKDLGASDLRSLDYVSDCDHNLLCPICQCPFIDPVPLVGQTSLDAGVKVTKLLNNMLDELVVKCPLHTDGCKAEIRRNEIGDHLKKYCDHTKIQTTVPNAVLGKHIADECLETPRPCIGAPFGCSHISKREDLDLHTPLCTLATLAPFLHAQKIRQDQQEAEQKLVARKLSVLEGGFAAIQILLDERPSSFAAQERDEASTMPLIAAGASTQDPSSDSPSAEDIDSLIYRVHSLRDSLREEIERIEASMAELDGRHSMMIINEGLRNKEDMAHTNAAINAMRMQLQWLTSARLQQSRPGAGAAGTSSASASSASSAATRAQTGSSPGPSGALRELPVRRLSDGSRQETKL